MIRQALSAVARNEALGGMISRAPIARDVVRRVVGGGTLDEALDVASRLADDGFWASLERAAPHVESDAAAEGLLVEYLTLVDRIAERGLSGTCEVAVLAEALGTTEGVVTDAAFARMESLCAHAGSAAVEVMIGMGPAGDVARTIAWAETALTPGAGVGLTLQASMRRTEHDCARLAGHRIRLVKGGHRGTEPLSHSQPIEIDKAYVRCAKVLLKGAGQPSFATHDPRLIEIVEQLAVRYARGPRTFEYSFYLGRLEGAQHRLAAAGDRVRVYVPYGPDWFERLVGGLAEQPSSIAGAVRSLLPGSST